MSSGKGAGQEATPGRYTVAFKKSALKELAKLPNKDVVRITDAIAGLAQEPRPSGCKKLKGSEGLYRIRSGNYRVIYSIEDDVLTVEVLKVKDRKDAY